MTNFNLYGPINGLGYGVFARGLIKGLGQLNVTDYHLDIIGQAQIEHADEQTVIQNLTQVPWNRSVPSINIWHEFDQSKFSGNKLIAFPIFETSDFFPISKGYLSQMDAIIVASKWAADVVTNAVGSQVPVHVVPGGANLIDTDEVNSTPKYDNFTMLHVGKYENRKSTLEIIHAYLIAFSETKNQTRLICHCFNPFDPNFAQSMVSILGQVGMRVIQSTSTSSIVAVKGSCIVEIPVGRMPDLQLSKLYKACHIGVFPSKGEGWNLPLVEAIQSGLPCIATNYSAHTEYTGVEYNYPQELLISNLNIVPAIDNVFFHGNRGNWATFAIEELVHKMRYAFDNYPEILANFDPTLIKNKFNWKNSAQALLDAVASVSSGKT